MATFSVQDISDTMIWGNHDYVFYYMDIVYHGGGTLGELAKRWGASKSQVRTFIDKAMGCGILTRENGELKTTKEKKIIKPTKKTLAEQQAECEGRKKKFYNSLVPFVERFGKETVREFYNYWQETNKSKTKMRWELEDTFDINLRLSRWERNKKHERRTNENGFNEAVEQQHRIATLIDESGDAEARMRQIESGNALLI